MPHNAETQAALTPADALQFLREGNERFLAQQPQARTLHDEIAATAGGQWPFAAILGCIDSRVPSELVFDQGIGDVFNVRVAGNVVNADILGSLEFACKVAGSKLILVLGHSSCGAVKGACDAVDLGHLGALLGRIRPAVQAVTEPADASQRGSGNGAFVQAVAEENVRRTVADIRAQSSVLDAMAAAGEIAVVGAMYDVGTGRVTFFD